VLTAVSQDVDTLGTMGVSSKESTYCIKKIDIFDFP